MVETNWNVYLPKLVKSKIDALSDAKLGELNAIVYAEMDRRNVWEKHS